MKAKKNPDREYDLNHLELYARFERHNFNNLSLLEPVSVYTQMTQFLWKIVILPKFQHMRKNYTIDKCERSWIFVWVQINNVYLSSFKMDSFFATR